MNSNCAVCGVEANLKCAGCKITFYCGKGHQKLHWKSEHKMQCKLCYKICTNDKFGRYIIATRDILKNEIILTELPLVVGPKITSEPICLGCFMRIKSPTDGGYECTKCHWPLCGKKCEISKNHLLECLAISKASLPCPITSNQIASAYCVITPLRCLLMKAENAKSYEKLMSLEDHLAERINTSIYQVLKQNLVPYIRNVLDLKQFDEELILKIAAILDTNSFEIRSKIKGNTKIRAIYPEAAMLSHDCVPNTRHIFDDGADSDVDKMKLTIIATGDIPKGSIITVTYTQPLKSTIERRDHLKLSKCFDCCCRRCEDPTELGTYCGSILCFQCKLGKIISTNPLDQMAKWQCENCQHELLAKQIRLGNKSIQLEIDQLINKRSPLAFEEFLIKYKDTLHPLNTHVIQVKYALIQLYGNISGFMLNELNDAGLKRKIELCTELLEIADRFEPGASHFRGKILLDLQDAIALETKREFDAELITRQQTVEKLGESMNLLQEAIGILKLEPGMSNVLQNRIDKLVAEI